MVPDSTRILQNIIERFRELCSYRQQAVEASGSDAVTAVHDMRVCIRRLRVALRLYQQLVSPETASTDKVVRKLGRNLRKLATKLGDIRDLDVQSALLTTFLAGDLSVSEDKILRRTIKRCQKRRPHAQQRLARYLRHQQPRLLRPRTLRRLAQLSSAHPQEANILSTAFVQPLTNFYQAATRSTASEALHQLRIATKKLRYTIEIVEKITAQSLATFIKPLKHLQDLLGEIHDCDVTLELLGFSVEDNIVVLPTITNKTVSDDLIPVAPTKLVSQLQNRRQVLVQKYHQFWETTFDPSFANQLTPILQRTTSNISLAPILDISPDTQ
jgi:CHAD domain-containing protein